MASATAFDTPASCSRISLQALRERTRQNNVLRGIARGALEAGAVYLLPVLELHVHCKGIILQTHVEQGVCERSLVS
jgi:hypothetical protein